MIESLTNDEIIESSKKWQSKISSGEKISMRDLFDLTADVIQIRATVGLAGQSLGSVLADLPYKRTRLRLVGDFGSLSEKTIDIFVVSEDRKLTDAYHLVEKEKKLDELTFLMEDSPENSRVSMSRKAVFDSLLNDGDDEIQGKTTFEDQPSVFDYSREMFFLAKAIWNAHLEQDAPLKNEYLPPVTPAAL